MNLYITLNRHNFIITVPNHLSESDRIDHILGEIQSKLPEIVKDPKYIISNNTISVKNIYKDELLTVLLDAIIQTGSNTYTRVSNFSMGRELYVYNTHNTAKYYVVDCIGGKHTRTPHELHDIITTGLEYQFQLT